MKTFLRRGILFLIGFLVFLELIARVSTRPFWWEDLARHAKRSQPTHIFIGSSRVACAVDQDVFAQEFEKLTGQKARAVNMGMGSSRTLQHYLGLKKVAKSLPTGLQGITVFLEAPDGIALNEGWGSEWTAEEYSTLLTVALAWEDVPRFLRETNHSPRVKANIVFGKLSFFVRNFVQMKSDFWTRLAAVSEGLSNWLLPAPVVQAEVLSQAGGTRNDEAGVKVAREAALRAADDVVTKQPVIESWNGSMVERLNDLVKEYGGKFVLYDQPTGPIFGQYAKSQKGMQSRKNSDLFLKEKEIPLLIPSFDARDEDFPDFWHLRKDRAPDFSRALAKSAAEMSAIPKTE